MTWLAVLAWGVIVGLDATSVVQGMVSRPLIAAALTGAILGHPAEGVALGVVLELFSIAVLPIGAARYPESGLGAVTGAFALIEGAGPALTGPGLLLAVVFGLGWERVAGGSVTLLRKLNGRLLGSASVRGSVRPEELTRLHLGAIAIDGVRALLVTATGLVIGSWLISGLIGAWRLGEDLALRLIVIALCMVLGSTLALFGGIGRRRGIFLLGLVSGLAILWLR